MVQVYNPRRHSGVLRQDDHELEDSLNYIERLRLKKQKQKTKELVNWLKW
jgi:hypothetical protein